MKCLSTLSVFLILANICVNAQITTQWGPDGFVKIEEGSGGFEANLDPADRFSRDHDVAGDINGDGILDLVVGARSDDDGGIDVGAVYILFMNNDGTVLDNQKISMLEGNFNEILNEGNFFGYGVAGIGDYDSDGIPDIAVSAPVPPNHAIYIIHLFADGSVKDYVKNENITAQGLSAVGDLNNDGRIDLVACDPGSDLGGTDIGAIRILFFNESGHLMPAQTVLISPSNGGFGDGLVEGDEFGGREVAMLGDIDSDGTIELAVGAFMSEGGKGAIWILSLNAVSFQVESKLKITEGQNGFDDALTTGANPNGTEGANFGHALSKVGDLNGDGIADLMTGANQQNEGWGYVLYLNADKTVKTYTRLNNTDGGFGLVLEAEERFSRSISFVGDLRGDGTIAINYGGGAGGTGTLYLLFFKPCEFVQQEESAVWSGGNALFINWDNINQTWLSPSLSFEQCTFKVFETDAAVMNFNPVNGQCSCFESNSELIESLSGEIAFENSCYSESVGAIEFSIQNHISIYPNPCASHLNITLESSKDKSSNVISIYNSNGILQERFESNSTELKIDMSEYSGGLYFIQIDADVYCVNHLN